MRGRRIVSLVAASGLALGVALVSAPVSNAYPPGTGMSLAASSPTVQVNTYVTLTASHVKPGCTVTFSAYGSSSKTARANNSAEAAVRFKFSRTGSITVKATTSRSYGCGGESATVHVTVYGAPSAPSYLRATSSSSTTVNASWKSPCSCGGLPLKWWTVKVTTTGGSTVKGPFTTTSPSYAFTGLSRYTYYYVVVTATNTGNLTGPASKIRIKTAR